MDLEIESSDVIKLILQFMKENNLRDSWEALSRETDICLNTVDDVQAFTSDIHSGRWDAVLSQLNNLKVPKSLVYAVYEQVIFEMLEIGERDLSREMLKNAEPMLKLKEDEPDRYLKIEALCKRPFFNSTDVYEMGSSKERRRREIADGLVGVVASVPPSRLLVLLGQALRYQQANGMIPKGGAKSYDLFKGSRKTDKKESDDKYPKRLAGSIKFSTESHPETAIFSPDGQSLVTGSVDGFIEVWDYQTCKLRNDLDYQAKDELMMHEEAVLCSTFSKDGELLATGSQKGQIKVWRLTTGACLRKFAQAHPQGVTSLCFSKDSTQLLSTSFDHTSRLHGLKSGKTLKEFRGHTSYVNSGVFARDGFMILTASSDGTVKSWDVRTTDCLSTFRPGAAVGAVIREQTILSLIPAPNNPEYIYICCKSSIAYLSTVDGSVVRSYGSGSVVSRGDFVCAAVSPRGKWLYCVGEDGNLYVFDTVGGQLESTLSLNTGLTTVSSISLTASSSSSVAPATKTTDEDVIGIAHHPSKNILVTITESGMLKLWRP